MELHRLRSEIDELDKKLITLLNYRVKLSLQIGEEKKRLDLAIEDKQREQQVMQMITSYNNGPLTDRQIVQIFELIIDTCKNIQQKTAGGNNGDCYEKRSN